MNSEFLFVKPTETATLVQNNIFATLSNILTQFEILAYNFKFWAKIHRYDTSEEEK